MFLDSNQLDRQKLIGLGVIKKFVPEGPEGDEVAHILAYSQFFSLTNPQIQIELNKSIQFGKSSKEKQRTDNRRAP